MPDLADALRRAIDRVADPCSVAVGAPVGVGQLGLIEAVDVDDDGRVAVTLCTTSPGCIYAPAIAEGVRRELAGTPGVSEVTVAVDHSVVWTDRRVAAPARAVIDDRRRRARELGGLTPYVWVEAPGPGRRRGG